jgi:hypothetical protein
MIPPKKPDNGQLKEMMDSLTDAEAELILEDPMVQEILRKRGKI